MLEARQIAKLVEFGNDGNEGGIAIIPEPELLQVRDSGTASLDLRLGRWFLTLRQSRNTVLDVSKPSDYDFEARMARQHFVPFGETFILHPSRFVLGSTLEWMKLPTDLAAYVTGKSSWARRGIVIETAAGIHPGFSGCLTLEIANMGEVPVALRPGMEICQIFFNSLKQKAGGSKSKFSGRRRPTLGSIELDAVLEKLSPTLKS